MIRLLFVAAMGASLVAAPPSSAQVCGNGQLEDGEECDDGNADEQDCCASCMLVATAPRCPRLDIRSPEAGTLVEDLATRIRLSGQATGVEGIDYSIVVNESPLPVGANGNFATEIPGSGFIQPITTHLRLPDGRAADGDRTAVIHGVASSGSDYIDRGLRLRINQSLFDHLDLEERLEEVIVTSEDDALVSSDFCIKVGPFCPVEIKLRAWVPEVEGLDVQVTATPAGIAVAAATERLVARGSANDCSVRLETSLEFSALLDASSTPGGGVDITPVDPQLDFGDPDVDFEGLCGFIDGDLLRDRVIDELVDRVSDIVGTFLADRFADVVNIRPQQGSQVVAGIPLTVAARLDGFESGLDGFDLALDTRIQPRRDRCPEGLCPPRVGDSLLVPGPLPELGLFTPSGIPYDFAVSVSASALNQGLKSLVERGFLSGESEISECDLSAEERRLVGLRVDTAEGAPVECDGAAVERLHPALFLRQPTAPPVLTGLTVMRDGRELPQFALSNLLLPVLSEGTDTQAAPLKLAVDLEGTIDLVTEPDPDVPEDLQCGPAAPCLEVKRAGDAQVTVLRTILPRVAEPAISELVAANLPEDLLSAGGGGGFKPFSLELEDAGLSFEVVEIGHQGGASTVYLNASAASGPRPRGVIDTALVIDSSGSMGSNDPQDRRIDAGQAFLAASQDRDGLAVVDFDGDAELLQPLVEVGDNRPLIRSALLEIDSSGGTDIGAGIEAACEALKASTNQDRPKAAILLTDGVGGFEGEDQCFVERGWPIFTFALGSAADDLLRDIADRTGGEFKRLDEVTRLVCEFLRVRSILGGAEPAECETLHVPLGETVSQQILVPPGQARVTFSSSWPGSDVAMSLVAPSGRVIDRDTVADDVVHDLSPTFEAYGVSNPEPGVWRVNLFGLDVDPSGEEVILVTTLVPRDGCASEPTLEAITCKLGELELATTRADVGVMRGVLEETIARAQTRARVAADLIGTDSRRATSSKLLGTIRAAEYFVRQLRSLRAKKTMTEETRNGLIERAEEVGVLAKTLRANL